MKAGLLVEFEAYESWTKHWSKRGSEGMTAGDGRFAKEWAETVELKVTTLPCLEGPAERGKHCSLGRSHGGHIPGRRGHQGAAAEARGPVETTTRAARQPRRAPRAGGGHQGPAVVD